MFGVIGFRVQGVYGLGLGVGCLELRGWKIR